MSVYFIAKDRFVNQFEVQKIRILCPGRMVTFNSNQFWHEFCIPSENEPKEIFFEIEPTEPEIDRSLYIYSDDRTAVCRLQSALQRF